MVLSTVIPRVQQRTAARPAVKARPLGIAKPELAESSGGAGPSWSTASGMKSELSLLELQSTEPRKNPNSQCRGAVASRSLVTSGSVSLATV